jgi:hypothetical protein
MVLLVVIAVSAMWAFVRPAISKSSSQINTDCFTLNLQVVECKQHSATNPANPHDVSVKVNRKSGTADLRKIKYAFIKSNGETLVAEDSVYIPDELETAVPLPFDLGEQIASVAVTGVLGDSNVVCPPTGAAFICEQVP